MFSESSNRGNPASLWEECLACGVLVVGARKRIVACSPEAAAHLRLKAAQLRNAPLKVLPAPLPRLIRDAAKSGKPATHREILLETAWNDRTTLRVSLLPLKTRASSQVVVVFNHPAAALKFERNMRRLDHLASLGTLSASLAHEIKNSMVAIRTFVELLAEKGQEPELADIAGRELQRINTIVSQMLRFAAPGNAAFQTVRIHDLLDHSLRLLQHQISAKSLLLRRNYQAAPDSVHGDDAQLRQLFMNLLLNALEAMNANGVLTVNTEIAEGKPGARRFQIRIQDSGVGIPPENLNRLFEPFFTTKEHGTGLGLAISRLIAQEHHGEIKVQSAVNQGSTFTFSLPAGNQ